MTIRSTYILPAGTYTNFRTRFVNTDVILQGNITFNGDTAIVCDIGSIDTSAATITVESGRTLCIAAEINTITLGPITAPGGTIHIFSLGFESNRGTMRTKNSVLGTPPSGYVSPLISCFYLTCYGYYAQYTGIGTSAMEPFFPLIVNTSQISMSSPSGVISRSTVTTPNGGSQQVYRVNDGGFTGVVLFISGTFDNRIPLSNETARGLYQSVATTNIVNGSVITMPDLIKEFYSGGTGREATITAINSRSNNTYDLELNAGNLAISGNSLLFVRDEFLPYKGYGYITDVFISSTTTRLILDWYGPYDLFVGLTVSCEDTQPNRSLSRFYAGGAGVPTDTIGYPGGVPTPVPSSGNIRYSNFYGSSKNVINTITTVAFGNPEPNRSTSSSAGGSFSWTVPPFIRSVRISAAGGGGGAAAGWGYAGNKSQGATAGGAGGGIKDLVFNVSPGDVIFGTIGNAGGSGYWGGSLVVTQGGPGSDTVIYWRNNAAGGTETLVAVCRAGSTATGISGRRGVLMALYPGVPGTSTIYYGSGQLLTGVSGQVYIGYDGGPGYDPWGYALNGYGSGVAGIGTVAVQAPLELGGNYQWAGLGQVRGWVAIQYPSSL